jgi:hypothetical protein
MGIEIGSCTRIEDHAPGRLELSLAVLRLSSFYGVDPVQTHPAALGRALASLNKGDGVDRAQAHFAGPGIEHKR